MASKSNDTLKSGGRSSGDSSSPQATRHGNADPSDIGAGEHELEQRARARFSATAASPSEPASRTTSCARACTRTHAREVHFGPPEKGDKKVSCPTRGCPTWPVSTG